MTHESILKINELFNLSLAKEVSNIKVSINYKASFVNPQVFKLLKQVVKAAGYSDVKGQIDTLYCIVDGLKTGKLTKIEIIKVLTGNEKAYNAVNEICVAFYEALKLGKISFDDRIRRDLMLCIYLDDKYVNFKTAFLKLDQQKKLYDLLISKLVRYGIIQIKGLEYRVNIADLYQQIYENTKSVVNNMYSRGISIFAIACHLWYWNRKFNKTPFLYSWSNLDFIKALKSTPLFEQMTSPEIDSGLNVIKEYWTVLSEVSLLTGKVTNIDSKRKLLNEIINKVLDSEAEIYIKSFMKKLKLVQEYTSLAFKIEQMTNNPFRDIEKALKQLVYERSIKVVAKEDLIAEMKYQFMISRILNVDFSSNRKDHLILSKITRQRVFE